MHYLSICAIIKNEALYIEEWLDFYIKQGVDHFYIYGNESEDDTFEKIERYIGRNLVTWDVIHGIRPQGKAYNHMIQDYRKETKWCAFLDCDEFLFSTKHPQFRETLFKLYDYEDVSVVAVHWLLFGSSGETYYAPEPVTKRFTKRAASVNPHVKSIVKLEDAISCQNPHAFWVKSGLIIDEYHTPLAEDYALSDPASANILRVNHYVTKSKEECDKRRKGGVRADTGMKHADNFFEAHDCNDVEDREIWKVL